MLPSTHRPRHTHPSNQFCRLTQPARCGSALVDTESRPCAVRCACGHVHTAVHWLPRAPASQRGMHACTRRWGSLPPLRGTHASKSPAHPAPSWTGLTSCPLLAYTPCVRRPSGQLSLLGASATRQAARLRSTALPLPLLSPHSLAYAPRPSPDPLRHVNVGYAGDPHS